MKLNYGFIYFHLLLLVALLIALSFKVEWLGEGILWYFAIYIGLLIGGLAIILTAVVFAIIGLCAFALLLILGITLIVLFALWSIAVSFGGLIFKKKENKGI